MENVMLTLIVAGIGGLIGIRLKIPAGALIGSMISVAIFNILSDKGQMPTSFKLVAQIAIGGFIGLSFSKETVAGLKDLILPTIILVAGLMVFSVALGFIMYKSTDMDFITALFSTAPGGIADMTIISEAYGADIKKVALLHLMRLVSVITVLPLIIRYIAERL